MQAVIFIPARYASTRLPGKPLCQIGNKTLIQLVYENLASLAPKIPAWVLTDDVRIEQHIQALGGNVLMTHTQHQSGTERCAEGLAILQQQAIMPDVVINIQGDEPLVSAQQVASLAALFDNDAVQIATLIKVINHVQDLHNSNRPKVVVDKTGKAMYFSRQTIPFLQHIAPQNWLDKTVFYKHIGMYAYRSAVLSQLALLAPQPLEQAESFEQLRWLEHGYSIYTHLTEHESPAIDTPEDLAYIRQLLGV